MRSTPPARADLPPPLPMQPTFDGIAPAQTSSPWHSKLSFGKINSALIALAIILCLANSALDSAAGIRGSIFSSLGIVITAVLASALIGFCFSGMHDRSVRSFRVGSGFVLAMLILSLAAHTATHLGPREAHAAERETAPEATPTATTATAPDATSLAAADAQTPQDAAPPSPEDQAKAIRAQSAVNKQFETVAAPRNELFGRFNQAGSFHLANVRMRKDLADRLSLLKQLQAAHTVAAQATIELPSAHRQALTLIGVDPSHIDTLTRAAISRAEYKASISVLFATTELYAAVETYLQYAFDHFEAWRIDANMRTLWSTQAHADTFNGHIDNLEAHLNAIIRIRAQQDQTPVNPEDLWSLPDAIYSPTLPERNEPGF